MVEIVSGTKQIFNGLPYWKCGFYFQRFGKRLHRAVWEFHNGEIPSGFAVHHIDGDRANNQIDNLALMPMADHAAHHMDDPGRRELSKEAIKRARAKAVEWHGSEEGKNWHKRQYELYGAKLHKPFAGVCVQCGKHYETLDVGNNMFCSKSCKTAHRKASGVDNEARDCAHCGKSFQTNKYQHVKYCSRECRVQTAWGIRRKGKSCG